jgi:hypothetical protein
MKRRQWTVSALEFETGLDRRTITDRLGDVDPVRVTRDKRGRETRYYNGPDAIPALFAVEPSRKARAPESADVADRLKELKVEEAELDLAERRGELVHAASVQGAFDAALLESNARFGAIPQGIADEVMSATDRDTVVRIIENAINGARELFANLRIPLSGPMRLGAERGAREASTPASNGSGVGGRESRSIS